MGRTIKAGQLATSAGSLAAELQTPRTTVQRLLSDLKEDGLISVENVGNRFSLISIINWHTYQNLKTHNGPQMGNQRATDGPQVGTIKPYNHITSKESALSLQSELMEPTANKTGLQAKKASPVGFDEFWQAYPRKVGKGNARTVWNSLQKRKALPELSIILAAIEKQKQGEQWREAKFIPHPSTWLNGERWADGQDETSGGTSQQASRPSWAENMGAIL